MKSRGWIRFLCILLCLSVLLPVVSVCAETTKVAAYLLRLRATASDKGRVIDAYPRGTTVTILRKGGEWTKVRVHGKVGYMKTNMLAYGRGSGTNSSGKSSGKSSGSSSSSSGTTKYVMMGTRLNLRDQPYSWGDIIASFRGGTKVKVLRSGKYWDYVEVSGLQGYMSKDYLVSNKGE